MRIVHTADWHLGHRLYGNDRSEEHKRALDWLLEVIEERRADLLIVAGDVFDSMNPSAQARSQYYDFLARLRRTGCRSAVIIGGNHDSPSQLDAPAELLRHLEVYVIGGAKDCLRDQVVTIGAAGGEEAAAAIVAAVPFLRDRDLKYSLLAESASDKVERMRQSIRNHYAEIAERAVEVRPGPSVPIIATGHLYASGGEDADDKVTNIYLADRSNIEASHFADCFDYVALGHIHRPQRVGGMEHIRYSGSLIPLTFGEAKSKQGAYVVDLAGTGPAALQIDYVAAPRSRHLITLRGSLEVVKSQLRQIVRDRRTAPAVELTPWMDVRVITPHPLPLLREELQRIIEPADHPDGAAPDELPRILRCSTLLPEDRAEGVAAVEARQLDDLHPEEVFHRLCHGSGGVRDDYPALLETFRELRGWMEENPPQ